MIAEEEIKKFKHLCEQQSVFKHWIDEPRCDGNKVVCSFKNTIGHTDVELENGAITFKNAITNTIKL